MATFDVASLLNEVKKRHPHMPEYYQAISEVSEDVLNSRDFSKEDRERTWYCLLNLAEPDRVISFRVNWQDDNNRHQVNRGYRVQFSNLLGPYKGGLRFAEHVNLSVLQFLGFEQSLKNALTGLPMGGAKGGADFDPHGKSKNEISRFCQAFMTQLARHIGPETDIPAGDIGVSATEIGYLFNQYRAITGKFSGVLTGKHPVFGGSYFREEATGYGCVYFANYLLNDLDQTLKGKRCAVSGAGNVALHAAEKLLAQEAQVISLSNHVGTVYFQNGLPPDLLEDLKKHHDQRGNLVSFAHKNQLAFRENIKPWVLEPEIAFPCATENELNKEDAKALIKGGCKFVFEGANMPCTLGALKIFKDADVVCAPSKAVNAGGVAVSGLEISQNRTRMSWEADRVDDELRSIMYQIYLACCKHGRDGEGVNYKKGANISAVKNLSQAIELYGMV